MKRTSIIFLSCFLFILLPVNNPCNLQNLNTKNLHSSPIQQSAAPELQEKDKLLRGINYAGWVSARSYKYTYPNGTIKYESGLPYWLADTWDIKAVTEDLNAMAKMGVRHIRAFIFIFSFLIFDNTTGFYSLNQSTLEHFDCFVTQAGQRGMLITPSFFVASGAPSEHPSFLPQLRVFETNSSNQSAHPVWYDTLITRIGEFTARYNQSTVINTWELVNEFCMYTGYIIDNKQSSWNITSTPEFMFQFFNETKIEIRRHDTMHAITISENRWPRVYNISYYWKWVPHDYNETYIQVSDYYSIHQYNDSGILENISTLTKPAVMGEIGCYSQLWNYSRYLEVTTLRTAWSQALSKNYSGFMPWEYAENIVRQDRIIPGTDDYVHDWGTDAYFLMSIYRNDTIDFINTTNWYFITTEPVFDANGLISFNLTFRPPGDYPPPAGFKPHHYYDESKGGIVLEFASQHLLMGSPGSGRIMNQVSHNFTAIELTQENSIIGKRLENIHVLINGTGPVTEIPAKVLTPVGVSDIVVTDYGSDRINFMLNATNKTTVLFSNGQFVIQNGLNYRVIFDSTSSTILTPTNGTLLCIIPSGNHVITIQLDLTDNSGMVWVIAGLVIAGVVGVSVVIIIAILKIRKKRHD